MTFGINLALVQGLRTVAVLEFAVWQPVGGHIFSWGSLNYTMAAMNPGFGEREFVTGLEAEAFSLIYTLILDFFEQDI